MRTLGIIGALFLSGCQEYNIEGGIPDYNGPNPPALVDPTIHDRIVQVTTKAADVLWVIDNSCSMQDNQNALATNFPTFMNYFLDSGLDYHIGVVSTDMHNQNQHGQLIAADNGKKYITPKDDQNAMQMFSQMSRLGTNGWGTEMGRAPVYTALALDKNTSNKGFLRDDLDSGVHVIVVSDEDDHSGDKPISQDEFIDYMNGLRPEDDLVTWNSIVTPPGSPGYSGTHYIDLTNAIGGILHDISVGDWVTVLDQLGVQAAGLKHEFFLSRLPVVDTITVKVTTPNGKVITFQKADWTYDGGRNSVSFKTYLPDPLSEVDIDYSAKASTLGGT